jgi:hypothetical protein
LCVYINYLYFVVLIIIYQPFTNEFPRADIHELIAPDLLHHIFKGTFKDHLVKWVEELLLHIHHNNKSKVNRILDDIDHRQVVCLLKDNDITYYTYLGLLLFLHFQVFAVFPKVEISSNGQVTTQRHL